VGTLSRIPGELNLVFVVGDDLPIAIDLDQDVTGSTWESAVYVDGIGAFATPPGEEYETEPGATVFAPTVTVTNAAAGQLSISLTDAQTDLLSPSVAYRWYLRQTVGSATRTILAGFAEARRP
jgi:hypothetical protein